ncbi:MAG: phosphoribosyltransferase [Bacillota bacterium]
MGEPGATPYDYASRRGIRPVTWNEFESLCRRVAQALAVREIDGVVGIARSGLIAATQVALNLRIDLFPVSLSRRRGDRVVERHPVWLQPPGQALAGRRVAVVDEIADTGETLAMAARAVRDAGAAIVVTAALAAYTWASPAPDVLALTTDALIVWPWGRYVLEAGRWVLHPEYAEALRLQGYQNPEGALPNAGGPAAHDRRPAP